MQQQPPSVACPDRCRGRWRPGAAGASSRAAAPMRRWWRRLARGRGRRCARPLHPTASRPSAATPSMARWAPRPRSSARSCHERLVNVGPPQWLAAQPRVPHACEPHICRQLWPRACVHPYVNEPCSAQCAENAALRPHRRNPLKALLVGVQVRMRVWERGSGGERSAAPLVDARSSTCAVEVGGGPWWDTWRTEVRSCTRCCRV